MSMGTRYIILCMSRGHHFRRGGCMVLQAGCLILKSCGTSSGSSDGCSYGSDGTSSIVAPFVFPES